MPSLLDLVECLRVWQGVHCGVGYLAVECYAQRCATRGNFLELCH